MTILKPISALIAVILFSACTSPALEDSLPTAPVAALPDDPLLNTIVSTQDGQPLSPAELYDKIAAAQIAYLGETHENQRHHELQLETLQALLERGKHPAIGFEFFSVEQTGYLQNYVQGQDGHGGQLSDEQAEQRLRQELGWGPRRDREWSHYFPLLKHAKEHGLTVFGTDLPDSLRARIPRLGVAGLSAVEKRLLQSTGFNDPVYRRYMEQTLIDAHCGWNNPSLISNLYETWLERNDAMAQSLVAMTQAAAGQPILMIIGAGHTKHNLAVVERVQYLLPSVKQLNLGYQELNREPQPAADYYQTVSIEGRSLAPIYEYLWFTPRASFEDPCERFKEQLQKHSSS